MKTHLRFEWVADGEKITAPEKLEIIRKVLDEEGPVIIEHAFYYGASAPDWMIFEAYDDFMNYLNHKAAAGDWITVWSFFRVCKSENAIAEGKCPRADGCVPNGGAY